METLVVNFIASPSSGKSTMASSVFSKLKWLGIDCELVTEFAKELVWEERNETFKNEVYIFAKQFHRIFRLKDKVQVIITDRPLILSAYYNDKYGMGQFPKLNELVLSQHNQFNNLNFFIERKKPYNPNGRNQTEKESNLMSHEIEHMLKKYDIEYNKIDGVEESIDYVVNKIINTLKRRNREEDSYKCPMCKISSLEWEWNVATDRKFFEACIESINGELMNKCVYVCPKCNFTINGYEIKKVEEE